MMINKDQPNWVTEYNYSGGHRMIKHVHEWKLDALMKEVKVYKCKCGARKTVRGDNVHIDYLDGGIVV